MPNQAPLEGEGAVTTEMRDDGDTLYMAIQGDFMYSIQSEFKSAYLDLKIPPQNIILDLVNTSYMDSSAAGMLLELKQYSEENEVDIHVTNMNDVVLEIFRVLNFHKLFKPRYNRSYFADPTWVSKYMQKNFNYLM